MTLCKQTVRITGEFEDYHLNPQEYDDIGNPGTPTKNVLLWIMDKDFNTHYAISEYGGKSHYQVFFRDYENAIASGRVDPGAGWASLSFDRCALDDSEVKFAKNTIMKEIQDKFDQNIRFKELGVM